MADKEYVAIGYVICDYVMGNCCEEEVDESGEYIKMFGFSRSRVILPTKEKPLDEVEADFARRANRNTFRFPNQIISK